MSLVSIIEGFIERPPQLLIQLYVFVSDLKNNITQVKINNLNNEFFNSTNESTDYLKYSFDYFMILIFPILSMLISILSSSYGNFSYYINYRNCYYIYSKNQTSFFHKISLVRKFFLFLMNFLFISSRIISLVILTLIDSSTIIILVFVHFFYHFLIFLLNRNSVKLLMEDEELNTNDKQKNDERSTLRVLFRIGYVYMNFFVCETWGQTVNKFILVNLVFFAENMLVVVIYCINFYKLGYLAQLVYGYFLIYSTIACFLAIFIQMIVYEFHKENVNWWEDYN